MVFAWKALRKLETSKDKASLAPQCCARVLLRFVALQMHKRNIWPVKKHNYYEQSVLPYRTYPNPVVMPLC